MKETLPYPKTQERDQIFYDKEEQYAKKRTILCFLSCHENADNGHYKDNRR